jgi:hypothetical protein
MQIAKIGSTLSQMIGLVYSKSYLWRVVCLSVFKYYTVHLV